jgi:hypothetical protein
MAWLMAIWMGFTYRNEMGLADEFPGQAFCAVGIHLGKVGGAGAGVLN